MYSLEQRHVGFYTYLVYAHLQPVLNGRLSQQTSPSQIVYRQMTSAYPVSRAYNTVIICPFCFSAASSLKLPRCFHSNVTTSRYNVYNTKS